MEAKLGVRVQDQGSFQHFEFIETRVDILVIDRRFGPGQRDVVLEVACFGRQQTRVETAEPLR